MARLPRRRRLLLAAGALLLFLLFADALWRSATGYRALDNAVDRLRDARPALEPLVRFDVEAWPGAAEIEAARTDLSEARRGMEHARGRLAYLPVLGEALGWLPRWGESLGNSREALDAGVALAQSSDRLVARLDTLLSGDERITDRAYQVFVVEADALSADLQALAGLRPEIERLSAVDWTGPFGAAEDYLSIATDELDRVDEAVALAAELREGLPILLGYDEPRTILLLGQNDHEVRPTGGFIGTAGIITVDEGRIVSRRFGASYDLDAPPGTPRRAPPPDLAYSLGIGEWHIRDSNWSPDFRESGATALDFLQQDQGIAADAVVAVDSHFIALLLEALGPVEVEGYPEPLGSENWFVQAENAIYSFEFGAAAAPTDIGGAGSNLVANPGFERTLAGWSPSGEAAVTHERSGGGAFGDGFVRVPGRADAGAGVAYVGAGNAQQGEAYTASVSIRAADPAAVGAELQLLVEASGGAYEQAATSVTLTEEWERFSLTYRWEEAAHTSWRITVRDAIGQSAAFDVDAVQVERGETASPYDETAEAATEGEQAESRAQARQAYLSPVLDTLIARAESAAGDTVPALVRALHRAAEASHLHLFSPHEAAQAVAERFAIDGAIRAPESGDLLTVVDANVSYNKIQPAISRSILYLAGEGGVTDVVIRWRNEIDTFDGQRYARLGAGGVVFNAATFEYDVADGTFASYTRLYLPADAQVIRVTGFQAPPVVSKAGELTVVGGRVVVPPGAEVTAAVVYVLPERPSLLQLWKQGGFPSTTARILVNEQGQQRIVFDGPILRDETLELLPRP